MVFLEILLSANWASFTQMVTFGTADSKIAATRIHYKPMATMQAYTTY